MNLGFALPPFRPLCGHLPPQGGKVNVVLALAFVFAVTSAAITPASAQLIEISSSRISLFPLRQNDTKAGALTYRGGLVLSSKNTNFGGLSDLAVSADGSRLLAVSDRGRWLRARLSYDDRGDLAGMSDGELSRMLDEKGAPLRGDGTDAEGMALEREGDLDGPVVVSFEQRTRILRYGRTSAAPTLVPTGRWISDLRRNRQLEAVTLLTPDTLLTFGESKPDDAADHIGAMEAYPGTAAPKTRMLSLASRDPFDITSVAKAPDGGVFLLERRFSLLGGLGTELRYIPAREIKEGARLVGEVLMNLSFQDANIDNMEGVAVRRGPNGETFLYLISDDNFSRLQRTLLLMFEWKR